MGRPFKPLPVKLTVSIIFGLPAALEKAERCLRAKFGPIDYESPVFAFDQTAYYEKEFGKNLKRKFISFLGLIPAERLIKIKLFANRLEEKLSKNTAGRAVNIDPGYVSLSKLVSASTKNFSHRLYMGEGIFEEITLFFKNKTFRAHALTYPDYRLPSHIAVFNEIRQKYRAQIAKKYELPQLSRCV